MSVSQSLSVGSWLAIVSMVFLLLFGSATGVNRDALGRDWKNLSSPAVPLGGEGQALVRVNDGFIIFRQAGASPEITSFSVKEDLSLAIERRTWSIGTGVSKKPRLATGTSAAWDGKRSVYILAGGSYSEDRYDVFRFDTATWTWWDFPSTAVTLSDGRRAGAQGAGSSIVYVTLNDGDYLYAVIGRSRNQVTPVSRWQPTVLMRYRLNPPTRGWEVISTFSEGFWPRYGAGYFCTDDGASLVVSGDALYFLAGSDCTDTPTKLFARFVLPVGPWVQLPSLTAAVGANDGASLAWDGNRYIYAIVGGHCETREDKRSTGREFLRFDCEIGEWEALIELPVPVGDSPGNRLAIVGRYLYFWQGSNSRCNEVLVEGGGNALYRINLSDIKASSRNQK